MAPEATEMQSMATAKEWTIQMITMRYEFLGEVRPRWQSFSTRFNMEKPRYQDICIARKGEK